MPGHQRGILAMSSLSRIWGGNGSSLAKKLDFRKEAFQWRQVTGGRLARGLGSWGSACPRGPVAALQRSLQTCYRSGGPGSFWSSPFPGSGSGQALSTWLLNGRRRVGPSALKPSLGAPGGDRGPSLPPLTLSAPGGCVPEQLRSLTGSPLLSPDPVWAPGVPESGC